MELLASWLTGSSSQPRCRYELLVNIMDDRAILRMDMRFYIGTTVWALLESLHGILVGLPERLTVAHVGSRR